MKPIYILGMGNHHPHANIVHADTLTTLGGKLSSEMAYRQSGLGPKDMDFAEIHDCFTITTLITLEDYGFCPKGEGGRWVEGGRIGIGEHSESAGFPSRTELIEGTPVNPTVSVTGMGFPRSLPRS